MCVFSFIFQKFIQSATEKDDRFLFQWGEIERVP